MTSSILAGMGWVVAVGAAVSVGMTSMVAVGLVAEAEGDAMLGSMVKCLRALGDETAAEARLQTAIEVAVRQGARMWELRAAMDLNRLWRSQGRHAEARAVSAPLHGSFTEGFEYSDLKAAAALLA